MQNFYSYHVSVIDHDKEQIAQLNKQISSLQTKQVHSDSEVKALTAQRDHERELLSETRKTLDREIKWREKSLKHTCWACSDELEELRMQKNSLQDILDDASDSRNRLEASQSRIRELEETITNLELTAGIREMDGLQALDLAT